MLKRRLGLILLASMIIASSSACARGKTTIPSNVSDSSNSSVETTSPPTSPPNVPSNSQPSVDSKNQVSLNSTVEPYFGTWIIKKYVPTGRVEGFSKKSASAYLGEKLIVDNSQIVSSEGTIKSPVFVTNTVTDSDFFNHWNIYFKNAAITGSTVKEIKVSNFNIKNGTEDRIGSNFIVTNDNRTYTFIGGALFELGK